MAFFMFDKSLIWFGDKNSEIDLSGVGEKGKIELFTFSWDYLLYIIFYFIHIISVWQTFSYPTFHEDIHFMHYRLYIK